MNLDDGGGDGDGDEKLDGDDGIDLPDKRPSEFGALHHHRVERRLRRLQIMLPIALVPHLLSLTKSEYVNDAGDRIEPKMRWNLCSEEKDPRLCTHKGAATREASRYVELLKQSDGSDFNTYIFPRVDHIGNTPD